MGNTNGADIMASLQIFRLHRALSGVDAPSYDRVGSLAQDWLVPLGGQLRHEASFIYK
jgi:hypothetical protein